MSDIEVYLGSLVASWKAFAAATPGSAVIHDSSYVAAYFTDPVLNIAVVATPEGVMGAASLFGTHPHAWWTNGADDVLTNGLRAAGYREDITTGPMLLHLGRDGAERERGHQVVRDVDPARIAEMNGVAIDLVRGRTGPAGVCQRGVRVRVARLTPRHRCQHLVRLDGAAGSKARARRRGLAGAVLATALWDAAERGWLTASLQATPIAESLYAGMGFVPVGRWQEWVRSDVAD